MYILVRTSTNLPIKSGEEISDLLNRPWTYRVGMCPTLQSYNAEGEVVVNNGKDRRDKTFKTGFFKDVHFGWDNSYEEHKHPAVRAILSAQAELRADPRRK